MINGASRRGCSWYAKHGTVKYMESFDRLPTDLRAYLANARMDWCAHCVSRLYRRVGTAETLAALQRLNKEDGK
jgi:Family of unknown function (DUF6525)